MEELRPVYAFRFPSLELSKQVQGVSPPFPPGRDSQLKTRSPSILYFDQV